jgi:hypothetical protein
MLTVPVTAAGEFLEGAAFVSDERLIEGVRFLNIFRIGDASLETARHARLTAELRRDEDIDVGRGVVNDEDLSRRPGCWSVGCRRGLHEASPFVTVADKSGGTRVRVFKSPAGMTLPVNACPATMVTTAGEHVFSSRRPSSLAGRRLRSAIRLLEPVC